VGRSRRLLEAVTPPIVVSAARRARRRRTQSPEWEYVPEGWARADANIRGWDVESVVDAYRAKLPAFRDALSGAGPLALATSAAVPLGEPSLAEQNQILAFAYAVSLASRQTDRVSILDWGGGVGYFSLLSRALLPDDVAIDYHCKDVPLVCATGRELLPEITFWTDDSCFDRQYDLVLVSNALQYSRPWRDLITNLSRASAEYLFVTRVPVVTSSDSFVVLQRAHRYEFETEYLSWVFNRDELLETARRAGMTLEREFLLGQQPYITGAPEQDETRAYLFTPSDSLIQP
jgi:putative methyltransferase (TIGR04325 family)